jgi:hypothetical protein
MTEAAIPLSPQLLLTLLPCGLVLGLVMLPLQGLSALGFLLQSQWQAGVPGLFDPLLPLGVACGTLTALALAWGPLKPGRSGGLNGVEALQRQPLIAEGRERALQGLRGPAQLARLVLLAVSQLGGLAVRVHPAEQRPTLSLVAARQRPGDGNRNGLRRPNLEWVSAGGPRRLQTNNKRSMKADQLSRPSSGPNKWRSS